MTSVGRGTGVVGYVQTAIDAKHHLTVAHEVTNVRNDRAQLAAMAGLAQEAMGCRDLTVVADRGYFYGGNKNLTTTASVLHGPGLWRCVMG